MIYWEEEVPVGSVTAKCIIEACSGAIHNNAVNLLAEYADASPETQSRIDDFVSISPSAAPYIAQMTTIWNKLASQIWHNAPTLHAKLKSRETIVDVYTRSHLNAHNFYTGHGMLEIGSKFNHSCTPNATYNKFLAADGRQFMRIFTIKPIRKGEQIFSTYIGGTDMLKTTRDRRIQLAAAKAFWCRCDRCIAPDILFPLPCPACGAETVRLDHVEMPWVCACGRRWWDAEITVREKQLRRLILNLDAEMNIGRFPPLQIVQFVVRDSLEDLGPRHYLAVQGRLLLEELFAFREITDILEPEEVPSRLANAWVYVWFLMRVVWKISPVVATNLSVLRLRTLLGKHGKLPPGMPRHQLRGVLMRSEAFLRSFWGEHDEDAKFFRDALQRDATCQHCHQSLEKCLVVCGSCASANYCSRHCQTADKEIHQEACASAREIARTLHSTLAF